MRFPILFYVFCFSLCANAQIVLTNADMPNLGDKFEIYQTLEQDTKEIELGNPGGNKFWNFTSLKTDSLKEIKFITVAGTPGETNFSNSEMVNVGSFEDIFGFDLGNFIENPMGLPTAAYYSESNTGQIILDGMVVDLDLGDYDFGFTTATLEGNIFMYAHLDYGEYSILDANIDMPIQIDSLNISGIFRLEFERTIEADAWGTMALPSGNYEVVRHKIVNAVRPRLGISILGVFTPIALPIVPDTVISATSYTYWTNKTNFPLVEISEANNIVKNVKHLKLPSQNLFPSSDFEYSVVCDSVYFENKSENALEYLWNFGEGNFSNESNPKTAFTGKIANVTLKSINQFGEDNQTELVLLQECGRNANQIANDTEICTINNILYIQSFSTPTNYTLEIFDLFGREVLNGQMSQEKIIIDLIDLMPAIYILKLSSNEVEDFYVQKINR